MGWPKFSSCLIIDLYYLQALHFGFFWVSIFKIPKCSNLPVIKIFERSLLLFTSHQLLKHFLEEFKSSSKLHPRFYYMKPRFRLGFDSSVPWSQRKTDSQYILSRWFRQDTSVFNLSEIRGPYNSDYAPSPKWRIHCTSRNKKQTEAIECTDFQRDT